MRDLTLYDQLLFYHQCAEKNSIGSLPLSSPSSPLPAMQLLKFTQQRSLLTGRVCLQLVVSVPQYVDYLINYILSIPTRTQAGRVIKK